MHFLKSVNDLMNLSSICCIDDARAALNLDGTIFGFYPVRVLPSKTAILPVNPKYLPRVIAWHFLFHILVPFYFFHNMLILVFSWFFS
jgi:hypothetical protein